MRFPEESSARRPTMTVDPDPSVLSTYPSAMRFAWPTGHPASEFGARLERKGAPPGDQRGWPPVQPVEDLPQVLGASPVPAPAVAGEHGRVQPQLVSEAMHRGERRRGQLVRDGTPTRAACTAATPAPAGSPGCAARRPATAGRPGFQLEEGDQVVGTGAADAELAQLVGCPNRNGAEDLALECRHPK